MGWTPSGASAGDEDARRGVGGCRSRSAAAAVAVGTRMEQEERWKTSRTLWCAAVTYRRRGASPAATEYLVGGSRNGGIPAPEREPAGARSLRFRGGASLNGGGDFGSLRDAIVYVYVLCVCSLTS